MDQNKKTKFEVSTEKFSGPLETLLELIEKKKLEITEINLAEVTDDFIAHVNSLGNDVSSVVLSDFVVVAASLLLIKSRVLLPKLELTEEEQTDVETLRERLRLYQEFKAASLELAIFWQGQQRSYGRRFLHTIGLSEQMSFEPPAEVTLSILENVAQRLAKTLEGLLPTTVRIKQTIVTLEQKIGDLQKRLTSALTISLKEVVGSGDKGEVIVSFLAILHMFAHHLITLEQGERFGDIIVRKSEA